LDIENALPSIYANKESIKQIFINLIKNSLDAMPNGGSLHIQTRSAHSTPVERHNTILPTTDRLEITVSDNGIGIPPEIKPNIFSPFITSKKNHHSGLGLSIVQDIVHSLHGTITCANNEDKGATFKITFPICDSALHNYGIHA